MAHAKPVPGALFQTQDQILRAQTASKALQILASDGAVLARLVLQVGIDGPSSLTDLAKALGISTTAVIKHVRRNSTGRIHKGKPEPPVRPSLLMVRRPPGGPAKRVSLSPTSSELAFALIGELPKPLS